jgi:predicted NUDIX family NTP pyrophosphohydrolase
MFFGLCGKPKFNIGDTVNFHLSWADYWIIGTIRDLRKSLFSNEYLILFASNSDFPKIDRASWISEENVYISKIP